MRLSFQAFSDNVSSFAADAAATIAQHRGPAAGEDLERVRRMALAELKAGCVAEAKELKAQLEELRSEDVEILGAGPRFFQIL